MKLHFIIAFVFICLKSQNVYTQAQSIVIANKFILSGTTVTGIATSSTPVSVTTLATTKAADSISKKNIADSLERFSTWKKVESYSGTTNSSGVYTITFNNAFSVAPNVQACIANQTNELYFIRISSITTTGCTINVYSRSSVTSLPVIGAVTALLGADTSPVSGVNINVIVMEK